MNPKEARNIEQVYKKLLLLETSDIWTSRDDLLEILSSIDDDQLCREAAVVLIDYKQNDKIPHWDLPNSSLLSPMILEAVSSILTQYNNAEKFTSDKHRYILDNFLALEQIEKTRHRRG